MPATTSELNKQLKINMQLHNELTRFHAEIMRLQTLAFSLSVDLTKVDSLKAHYNRVSQIHAFDAP
jgi:hypothetical protein